MCTIAAAAVRKNVAVDVSEVKTQSLVVFVCFVISPIRGAIGPNVLPADSRPWRLPSRDAPRFPQRAVFPRVFSMLLSMPSHMQNVCLRSRRLSLTEICLANPGG